MVYWGYIGVMGKKMERLNSVVQGRGLSAPSSPLDIKYFNPLAAAQDASEHFGIFLSVMFLPPSPEA